MGILDTIKEKIKDLYYGASKEDLIKIVSGDPDAIKKLVKDEHFRKGVFARLEEYQNKYPQVKQKFLKVLNDHLLNNKSLRNTFNKELLTKPDYSKMNELEGLIEITKASMTPEEIKLVESKGVPVDQYAYLKMLKNLKLITEKDFKKEKVNKYIATNLKTTWAEYQKYKQVTTVVDKLSDVLDAVSLGLAVYSGGATAIEWGLLRKTAMSGLKRFLVKSASRALLMSDLTFLSSIGLRLTNDVLIKNQNPSTWDIALGLLSMTPFVKPVNTKLAKVAQKMLPDKITIEDMIAVQRLAPHKELGLALADIDKTTLRSAIVSSIEKSGFVDKKVSITKQLEPVFKPMVEAFSKTMGEKMGTWFARYYIRPHEVKMIKNIKQDMLRRFVAEHIDDFKLLYESLGDPENIAKIFKEKPQLLEFFKNIVSSKYYINRFRYDYKRLVQAIQRIEKEVPEQLESKIFLKLGEGENSKFFKLHELLHDQNVIKEFEDFIEENLRKGIPFTQATWLYKEGEELKELKKVYTYAKFPDTITYLYIPTSDFPIVFRTLIKDEEIVKERLVYLPEQLVEKIFEKAKSPQEAYEKIKEYIANRIFKNVSERDIEIVERFEPITHLFPRKELFDQVFDKDSLKKLEKMGKHLSKLDEYLQEVKEKGLLIKELERKKKEIRDDLKSIANQFGNFSEKVRTTTLIKKLKELEAIEPEYVEEIENLLKELKSLKEAEIIVDSKLAKKVGGLLEKIEQSKPEIDIKEAYENFVEFLFRQPWDMKRTSIQGFLRFTDFPDKKDMIDYLTKSYLRTYALEENIILGHMYFADKVIKDYFGDTAFGKAWELVRAYHFGEGLKGQLIKFTNRLSKLFTLFNPATSAGAYLQVKTGISMLFPSYKVATSTIDLAKEILTNKTFAKTLLEDLKSSKILDNSNFMPSWFRFFETFLENDLKLSLLKNKEFANEVARYFNLKEITPDMVEHVAKILADLIDNPASLGMLFGGSKIGHGLATVQSWYHFVVTPFQIASTNLIKALTGPEKIKYLRNSLYLTLLGATFLPSSISPVSAPLETVRKLYDDVVSPVIAFVHFLTTGQKVHESWLENKDPVIDRAVKTLMSNISDVPVHKLTGRLLTDLGQIIALHGDEHQFGYTLLGLQKLVNFLSKLDITEKGLVTSGSASTSFDFAFPVLNTISNLATAFVERFRTTPEQFWKDIIMIANRTIPIFRNLKYGLFRTLTAYGPQTDPTQDKMLADFIKDLTEDERTGFVIGLAHNLGVLLSHPTAFARMFDIIFTHSFVTNAKNFVEDLFTDHEPKRVEYIYLPKVRSYKDYKEKILGREELILQSLERTETKETALSALQTYFNVVGKKYVQGKTELNIDEDKQILKSLLAITQATIYKHREIAPVILENLLNIIHDLRNRYDEDTVKKLLTNVASEVKLEYKLRKHK